MFLLVIRAISWDTPDRQIKRFLAQKLRKYYCSFSAEVGGVERNADPKRKTRQADYNKQARRHQEEALDDALKNTFPASDPISIEQPAPPAADHDE